MSRYLEAETARAEAVLAAINAKIKKADTRLAITDNRIVVAQRELDRIQQIHQVNVRQFATEAQQKQDQFDAVLQEKNQAIEAADKRYAVIMDMINKATGELNRIRSAAQEEGKDFDKAVARHTQDIIRLQDQIARYRDTVINYEQQATASQDTLIVINESVTAAQNNFAKQKARFQETIKTWENKLQKIKHEFGSYEVSMQTVRAADAQRTKELDEYKRQLTAQERKINEDRRDLKDRRERFYQTKELQ